MGKKGNRPSSNPWKPSPGPWFLDWSLIDQEGPFAWPAEKTKDFRELAEFLTRLNLVSLDKVFDTERFYSHKNGIHGIDEVDLSIKAQQRMQTLYESESRKMDSIESQALGFVVITFCLEYSDSRRIIVLYNSYDRVLHPLWWDRNHEVCGNPRSSNSSNYCIGERCYHSPLPYAY